MFIHHFFYKTPIRLLDNDKGLDRRKAKREYI